MKQLSFLLLFVFLCLLAVGCGGKQITLIPLEGWQGYTIVRSETAVGGEVDAAISLKKAIEETTGAALTLTTDWVRRGESIPTDTLEILVGSTNRPESGARTLRYNDCAVEFANGRVTIAGGSSTAILAAVDWFIENCVTAEGLLVPETAYIAEGDYPLADVTLDGVSLCEFAVEWDKTLAGAEEAAAAITTWLAENTGVLPDSGGDTGHRIRLVSDPTLDFDAASAVLADGVLTLAVNPYGRGISDAVALFCDVLEARTDDAINEINQTASNLEEKHMLKYLNNTYAKLMAGETLNISFTGGSVTDGMGATNAAVGSWAAQLCDRFENTYGVTVNRNKVSIGGTGTYLAAFRYERDIRPKNPDLLFIEHTVNDRYNGATYDEVVRASETLVRKAYEQNPNVDIIYVLTFDQGIAAADYDQLRAHRDVADKYGLMYVKLSSHFYSHIAATGNAIADYFIDGVHPNDKGYTLYADFIWETIMSDFPAEKTGVSVKAHTWDAEPLSSPMMNARMAYSDEIPLDGSTGWTHQNENFSWKGKAYHGRLFANQPGAKLTYTFEGTDFGILYGIGPNMGKVSVAIDGGEPLVIDAYRGSINPKEAQVAVFLEDGSHTAVIELLDEKNDASGGTEFEIGALLLN